MRLLGILSRLMRTRTPEVRKAAADANRLATLIAERTALDDALTRLETVDLPGLAEDDAGRPELLKTRAALLGELLAVHHAIEKAGPVKQPGKRGGRYYYTKTGKVRYGERPTARVVEGERLAVVLKRQASIRFPGQIVRGPEDVAAAFRSMVDLDRERLWSVALDTGNRIRAIECVSVGSVAMSLAIPREILKAPLLLGDTARLILVHNHPSGVPVPSQDDIAMHGLLGQLAAELPRPMVVEHVIVGLKGWVHSSGRGGEHVDQPRPFTPLEVESIRQRRWATGDEIITTEQIVQLGRGLFHPDDRTMVALLVDNRMRLMKSTAVVVNGGQLAESQIGSLLHECVTLSASRCLLTAGRDGDDWQENVRDWVPQAVGALRAAGLGVDDAVIVGRHGYVSLRDEMRSLFGGGTPAHVAGPVAAYEEVPVGGVVPSVVHTQKSTTSQLLLFKGHKLQGRREVGGLGVSIENRVGSVRYWTDHDGTEGKTRMRFAYGYIRGTQAQDGEEVDCFLGPLARTNQVEGTTVFVVRTRKPPDFREIDESKCMIGWPDAASARAAFLEHYGNDERFIDQMDAIPWEDFTAQVRATKDVGGFMHGDVIERGDLQKTRPVLRFFGRPSGRGGA